MRSAVCVFVVFVIVPMGAIGASVPVITAAASDDAVRFSSPGAVCQIRVEIASPDGTPLFDSSWRDGNVLDWPVDATLPSGSYRCVVHVKDLDGNVVDRAMTAVSNGGQWAVDAPDASASPKVTVLVHDGTTGSIVSTGGDLAFRFGNVLAGKDLEKMRLTSSGRLGIGTETPQSALDVNGTIRAADGILFRDGSVLTAQEGQLVLQRGDNARPVGGQTGTPLVPVTTTRLTPRSNAPMPRFLTTDTGVGIWNAAPAFTLDVGGVVNTTASYDINSTQFVAGNVSNTFVGVSAGASNTGSNANTFIGADSGHANTTGVNNTFVGVVAGDANTTGQNNVFVGRGAGVATNANANTAVGYSAGSSNTTGTENAYFGNWAGGGDQTGSDNTALGSNTTYATNSLSYATAIGAHAECTQSNTVVIGSISGYNGATATPNVGITLWTPNQALGVSGGITVDADSLNNGTDSINTVVAFGVGANNNISGEAIGSQRTTGGNQYGLDFYTAYGKRMSITNTGRVGIGTAAPSVAFEVATGLGTLADAWTLRSSARFKKDIEPIAGALEKTEALRGVTFVYKDTGAPSVGFIAEEVASVLPQAVQRDSDGTIVGLDYNRITPLLVEAVKSQQKTISNLEERLAKLEAEVAGRK